MSGVTILFLLNRYITPIQFIIIVTGTLGAGSLLPVETHPTDQPFTIRSGPTKCVHAYLDASDSETDLTLGVSRASRLLPPGVD